MESSVDGGKRMQFEARELGYRKEREGRMVQGMSKKNKKARKRKTIHTRKGA